MASGLTAPVNLGSATGGLGATTLVITTTTRVAPGDGVAVFAAHGTNTTTISSVVDSRGNTYTATANSPATGSVPRSWIYVCASTGAAGLLSGDTITITFSSSSGGKAARAVSIRGVKASGAADTAPAGASGSSTTPNSGATGALAQADELELGLIATNGVSGDTFTIGGGFTLAGGSVFNTTTANVALYPAYKIVTVATGDTYSATITSRAWVASVASFRAGTFPDTLRLAGVGVEANLTGGARGIAGLVVEVDAVETLTERRTGGVGVNVDLDRRPGITLERQTGAVGVNVDLQRTGITLNRQTGSVGVTVDLKPVTSVDLGTVSQATAVALSTTVIPATITGRTATTGVAGNGAPFTITLPSGVAEGDFLILFANHSSVGGIAAPTGWTRAYSAATGTMRPDLFWAPYSPTLTLDFQNVAAGTSWVCNAYYEPFHTLELDGSPVAATNNTSAGSIPTGQPTTGSAAGDYEVLAHAWIAASGSLTADTGMTVDIQRVSANGCAALGHNNSTLLGASETCPAFVPTISVVSTPRVGIGILLRPVAATVVPLSVSTTQPIAVSLQTTYIPAGGSTSLTVTASQATSLRLTSAVALQQTVSLAHALVLVRLRFVPVTRATTQAQSVALVKAITLRRTLTQGLATALRGATSRLVTTTQATSVRLQRQFRLTRLTTQAQAATRSLGKGYQRIVTAIQGTALARQRLVRLTRATTGNRRVQTLVTIAPALARAVRVTVRPTSRLVKQVRLTRSLTVGQAAVLSGVPVQLRAVTAVQTRSLALGRAISLTRAVAQPQLAILQRLLDVVRVAPVLPVLSRVQQVGLTREVAQATAVSLAVRDLTPLVELTLSTTVGQALSLSTAGVGQSARSFVVVARSGDFVVADRAEPFTVRRRGVRFTVER